MSILTFRPASLVLATFAFSISSPAAVNFETQLLPVIQKKCLDCHSAPKMVDGKMKQPKGELRMDAAWAMLKGGENGAILKPGDSSKSPMYEAVTLPKDEDGFMPPKGDPLTEAEVKLLKEWIDGGADFGAWKGSMEGAPADVAAAAVKPVKVREHEIFYKALGEGLKPAGDDLMTKAKAGGAQLALLKPDSALLRADFLTGVSKCDDEKVAVLLPLKDHIAQLDLGRTVITDGALKTVGQFPRLAALDLRQTKITDAGLASLSGLKKLQTLNLYGTDISDAGVKHLTAIKSLRQVTLWQTKVTDAGAKQLLAAVPGVQVTLK